jgi:hypothetical protein
MRVLQAGLRPAFALFLIAHALAHVVLPSRGWIEPARLGKDFMPFILYAVAVSGFTIAGLGLLEIRPFKWMMRPAMVLASAYSLVAIYTFGHPELFWGGAADLVLLLTGLTGAYRYLPAREPLGRGLWHDMGVSAATALVLVAAMGVVLFPLALM